MHTSRKTSIYFVRRNKCLFPHQCRLVRVNRRTHNISRLLKHYNQAFDPKHNRNVMDLMVIIGFNGNYNGVYWYVMDYIDGILNLIGKMPKTQ